MVKTELLVDSHRKGCSRVDEAFYVVTAVRFAQPILLIPREFDRQVSRLEVHANLAASHVVQMLVLRIYLADRVTFVGQLHAAGSAGGGLLENQVLLDGFLLFLAPEDARSSGHHELGGTLLARGLLH